MFTAEQLLFDVADALMAMNGVTVAAGQSSS
jgi:hypothetical protein